MGKIKKVHLIFPHYGKLVVREYNFFEFLISFIFQEKIENKISNLKFVKFYLKNTLEERHFFKKVRLIYEGFTS